MHGMMAWVHAAIGAAAGAQSPSKEAAFGVGVVTHGMADLVPHRDYDLKIELPLAALMLTYLALMHGVRSRQFWGAVGGIAPDIENGLEILGILPGTVFPTHTARFWFIGHGRKVKSPLPQVALALVCLWLAAKNMRR